jgi:hypothetical protein
MPKAKPSGSNQHKQRSHDATDPPTLADLGISKDQSSRWQKLATMPEQQFEAAVAEVRALAICVPRSVL